MPHSQAPWRARYIVAFPTKRGLSSSALRPHYSVAHQLINKHFPKSIQLQVSMATSETLPAMDFESQRQEKR